MNEQLLLCFPDFVLSWGSLIPITPTIIKPYSGGSSVVFKGMLQIQKLIPSFSSLYYNYYILKTSNSTETQKP